MRREEGGSRMKIQTLIFLIALTPIYLLGFTNAHAASTHSVITTTHYVPYGSKNYYIIRSFIKEHSGNVSNFGKSSSKPNFKAGFTTRFSLGYPNAPPSSMAFSGKDGPPYPPPGGSYNSGDTFSISLSSGGITETWTYIYVANGNGTGYWVLSSYTYKREVAQINP